jgi:hypothetical protein
MTIQSATVDGAVDAVSATSKQASRLLDWVNKSGTYALVVELVDTGDLKSSAELRRAGSSPARGTILNRRKNEPIR